MAAGGIGSLNSFAKRASTRRVVRLKGSEVASGNLGKAELGKLSARLCAALLSAQTGRKKLIQVT